MPELASDDGMVWEHVVLCPCYVQYSKFKHMSLNLNNEFLEAKDNMDATDKELQIQAWHDLMAIIKCFRERHAWDSKARKPMEEPVDTLKGRTKACNSGMDGALESVSQRATKHGEACSADEEEREEGCM
jgi:hypothetical protein